MKSLFQIFYCIFIPNTLFYNNNYCTQFLYWPKIRTASAEFRCTYTATALVDDTLIIYSFIFSDLKIPLFLLFPIFLSRSWLCCNSNYICCCLNTNEYVHKNILRSCEVRMDDQITKHFLFTSSKYLSILLYYVPFRDQEDRHRLNREASEITGTT